MRIENLYLYNSNGQLNINTIKLSCEVPILMAYINIS